MHFGDIAVVLGFIAYSIAQHHGKVVAAHAVGIVDTAKPVAVVPIVICGKFKKLWREIIMAHIAKPVREASVLQRVRTDCKSALAGVFI